MVSRYCELPVGYQDGAGKIHRRAVFRSLSGREEEVLASSQNGVPSASLVSEVLASCLTELGDISPITVDIARQLTVVDQQHLLLQLRSITFGENVQAVVQCPAEGCGEKVDIDFKISQLPTAKPGGEREHEFILSEPAISQLESHQKQSVRFRLPVGEDQEMIASIADVNEAEALTKLLSRCLISVGDIEHPTLDQTRTLPSLVRREIEQHLEEASPGTELIMDIECPECGQPFSAPFNIQDFFFGELRISDAILRKEVHYLAYHYHWSEAEIMAMPRQRRRQYIDTLSEEIERMNDAAQYV